MPSPNELDTGSSGGVRRHSRTCERCGHTLDIVRRPLSRLRWTRAWWQGVRSIFTRPLLACPACGTVFTWEGDLVHVGAAETSTERRLRAYRKEMANLRDSFGTVAVAGWAATLWMLFGPGSYDPTAPIIAASIGSVVLIPYTYFARKVRSAKKELKSLKVARLKGELGS